MLQTLLLHRDSPVRSGPGSRVPGPGGTGPDRHRPASGPVSGAAAAVPGPVLSGPGPDRTTRGRILRILGVPRELYGNSGPDPGHGTGFPRKT